jgi:glycosyltransferase involved in cell wall biosynthesis
VTVGPKSEVVYVLPDKLGGVFNYVRNLLTHRRPDGLEYAAVLTDNAVDAANRGDEAFDAADRVERLRYSLPPENIWAVLRRLSKAVGVRPGILVANDWIELALATAFDTGKSVVAVNHGDFDFYYNLAVRHAEVIDAFVTYTERMASRLRELLPERHDSILLLRYGVDIPRERRARAAGPLRLIYSGRLARDKGIFDLPQIAAALRHQGHRVQWTIQGAGPDAAQLRAQWPDATTHWTGLQPMSAVLQGYHRQDVLVMPSRNEGLPVALLEAGAAGVVPVVSNLPSGIPEIVQTGVTGFRPEPGDIRGFVEAIARLERDRDLLESASAEVRTVVSRRYDAMACAAEYQRLYQRLVRRRREWRPRPLTYGSRLDRPWIPNPITRLVRSAFLKTRGTASS